jgi:dipeptidyl aminopeptidase/acylaminoacyl peptidase
VLPGPAPAPGGAGLRWAHRSPPDAAGRRLPEWVFTPDDGGHGGTVVYLHGGPGGRMNPGYDPVLATFVGAGWTVVGMNYPGSSGHGREYLEQSRGDWGGADARAIEGRLRSLSTAGTGPVCLYGQSYGGYLALLAAAALPQVVHRIAVWAPVTDLPALLDASSGSQRRWLERELGELAADRDQLWRRSPISRLPELRATCLLVGHGRHDERCPVEQSRRLVRELGRPHAARGSVRYLEDPDSPHIPRRWHDWAAAAVSHFGLRAAGAGREGAACVAG